jgi:cytidyltransferase-like protein
MIGLLGGTFDPPPNGHVELAQAALKAVPLDRLVVLVAEQPGIGASSPTQKPV